jgi:hypothetical protein
MPATQQSKGAKRPANVVSRRRRRIAIIAAPPVRMLDVFGPAEVFTDANRLRGGEPIYEVEIVSATDDEIRRAYYDR